MTSFREVPLAEALRDLCFDRADGVLEVDAGGRRVEIYADAGEVFYCKSDAPDLRLDRVLVKWGLVPEDRVAGLVQRAGRDVRGTLVRERVFPSPEAFDQFMGQVLVERIMDLFAFPDGEHSFRPEDVRALRQVPFPATTPNLVLEGVRRWRGAEAALEALVRDDPAPALVARPTVAVESLRMGPAEGFVFSQLDGSTRLSAAARVSPLGGPETVRLVYALLLLDVVTHPAHPGVRFQLAELTRRTKQAGERDAEERELIETEYRRVRAADLFEVVPGGWKMPPDQLRARLRLYQDQWKPDRFTDRIAREKREELLYLAGRAGEALLGVLDAERKKVVEPAAGDPQDESFRLKRMELLRSEAQERQQRDETVAAAYLQRAQDAVRAKDFHTAVEHARESVRLHETPAAQALLAEALAQNPRWIHRAEEAYLKAIQLDAFNARLPLALGHLYASRGLKEKAREQYERALQVQPDLDDAKAAIKALRR